MSQYGTGNVHALLFVWLYKGAVVNAGPCRRRGQYRTLRGPKDHHTELSWNPLHEPVLSTVLYNALYLNTLRYWWYWPSSTGYLCT